MLKKHRKLISLAGAGCAAICIAAAAAIQIVDQEQNLSIQQVPAPVQATILAQANGGSIGEIEQEAENGRTIYEADVTIEGQEIEIKVAPDGTLVARNAEDAENEEGEQDEAAEGDDDGNQQEEQVLLTNVPAAVSEAIAKEAGGDEIKEIEKETEGGRIIYSAEVVIDGQKVCLEIAPDGTLLGREAEDQDDDRGR